MGFASALEVCKIRELRYGTMTRAQAEQTADSLREAGWPVVYVEINDDGTWRAVAEDWRVRDGWLLRRMSALKKRPNDASGLSASLIALPDRFS
jgi:hypothetical protein